MELDRRKAEEAERSERWRERRSEWRNQFETGISQFFDAQLAQTNDPVEQERLIILLDLERTLAHT